MTRRGWVIAAVVVLLGLVLGLLGRSEPDSGLPFDPSNPGPAGSAALVEVLRELGAEVTVSAETPSRVHDVAVVLVGGHDAATVDRLEGWVRSGGRLILADATSPLNPLAVEQAAAFDLFGPVPLTVDCDHPAMAAIDRVASSGWTSLQAPADASLACLPTDTGVALAGVPFGEGELIVFGGRGAWTNDALGNEDNAALGAALVQPAGGPRVVFLRPPAPGTGGRSLGDLVPPRVRSGIWQLVIAFGVLAWARSRRHGPPVDERLPTSIRGSEMVAAVAGLLERTGQRQIAAAALQDEFARCLEDRVGLPRHAQRRVLADTAAGVMPADAEELWDVLRPQEITDDRELLALARRIARVRARLGLSPT